MIVKSGVNYVEMGKRIRERRRELHMTQEELAERTEASISFIGHIERMEKMPSIDTIVRICRCMDMSLDFVVLGKRELRERDYGLYEDLRRLVERYS